MHPAIYPTLQERAAQCAATDGGIARCMVHIAGETYFRKPAEMSAQPQWWKLQAAEMIARVVRDAVK